MAEFQEVMRQWRRMCDTYTTDDAISCCKGCPMAERGCGSIYETGNADPDVIERKTMTWAAENPEPVYPTWAEWLLKVGAARRVPIGDPWPVELPDGSMLETRYETVVKENERIPAYIAEPLKIEPKEG